MSLANSDHNIDFTINTSSYRVHRAAVMLTLLAGTAADKSHLKGISLTGLRVGKVSSKTFKVEQVSSFECLESVNVGNGRLSMEENYKLGKVYGLCNSLKITFQRKIDVPKKN